MNTVTVNGEKYFSQSEVDAIRKEAFLAGRKRKDLPVGNWLMEYDNFDAYLSSLNTSDTGKEGYDSIRSYSDKSKDYVPVDFKQPTNDNAFVWTPELINEFMNEGEEHYYDWSKEIKSFQQSKQSTPVYKKWWEKLGIKFDGLTYTHPEVIGAYSDLSTIMEFLAAVKSIPKQVAEPLPTKQDKEWRVESVFIDGFTWVLQDGKYINEFGGFYNNDELPKRNVIKSVRRLSDNVVFRVGDNTNKGLIQSFVIITDENRQTAVTAHLDERKNIGKIAVKVSGSLGATCPNQLLEDLISTTPSKPIEMDNTGAIQRDTYNHTDVSSNNDDVACLSFSDVEDAILDFNNWDKQININSPNPNKILAVLHEKVEQKLNSIKQ